MRRPAWLLGLAPSAAMIAACNGSGGEVGESDPPVTVSQDVAPVATADPADVLDTTTTSSSAPASTLPPTTVPGVFADDNGTELAVGVLTSWTGFGQVQSLPISVAAGKANRDIAFEGSPFDFDSGSYDAPFVLTDEGDLTEDPAQLRESFGVLMDGTVDVVIGALPPADIADFTAIAEASATPFVAPNYVDDGSVPSDLRLDIGGSVDAQLDVLVGEIVVGEYPGIVVVGVAGDPTLRSITDRLLGAGASPLPATVGSSDPTPEELAEVVAAIEESGDGSAVVLVSPGASSVIAQELAGTDVKLFAGDVSLSRTEAAALDDLGADQLVVVRRVDDVRRPEQAPFAAQLAEFDNGLESTFHSAESYDAYALAALATAENGRAETSSLVTGMIEVSRRGEPCTDLEVCFAFIANGIDIDYDGWSGPIEFDDGGTAQATWFGVQIVDPTTGGVTSERFVLGTP